MDTIFNHSNNQSSNQPINRSPNRQGIDQPVNRPVQHRRHGGGMAEGSWIRRTRRVAGRVRDHSSKNSSLKFLVYLQGIFLSHQAGPSRHRARFPVDFPPFLTFNNSRCLLVFHSFFEHHFGAILHRFGPQLGPQLGSKIVLKSVQEPSKSRPKSLSFFDCFC